MAKKAKKKKAKRKAAKKKVAKTKKKTKAKPKKAAKKKAVKKNASPKKKLSSKEKTVRPDFDQLRPSEFMRARRPELFSDSKVTEEVSLKRDVFEYHLDSLTSRKQEYEFEHFARSLAEKELCPNLLPQTGPTGGGDSKTDTETYPVADSIALRWYVGIGREASQERWAFAFSAKKRWQGKVRSDVDNIVKTKRGYKLIYFISNQFIRDKARADIEDELSKKHNVPVRVLDRSWIVEKVFENERVDLAIEKLGLVDYERKSRRSLGPRDTARKLELEELEKNIEDVGRYKGVRYQLAEDCMHAALLARNLELPRVDVDGRFDRAEKIAEKVNYQQQKMRIAYIRTWTAFHWYDDVDELNKGYGRVEAFVVGSEQYEDISKLGNLWMLLAVTVRLGKLNAAQSQFAERTATLKSELDRLASDTDRPNNALQAKIRRLLMDFFESLGDEIKTNGVLDELHETIKTGQDYLEFPFEFISEISTDLSSMLPDNEKIDEILETIIHMTGERKSQGEAGRILLQYGFQKLEHGKKYEAIKLFGRAQEKLFMAEYHEEFVSLLAGGALAYESAGLLWAARRNMLLAANEVLKEFWKHGHLEPIAVHYLRKLVWLELQLGRVPYVLAWRDTLSAVANSLALDGSRGEQLIQDLNNQDLVLGLLFLKTDMSDLNWLGFMPDVLEKREMIFSWMALLYALGYEESLQKEGVIPDGQSSEDTLDFFSKWISQPASKDLPEKPELLRDAEVILSTYVVGCHLKVEVVNEFEPICLGETLLAALESFLATGIGENILPYSPECKIIIKPSEYVTGIPQYHLVDDMGVPIIEIRYAPNTLPWKAAQRKEYNDWLRELVLFVVYQIACINDVEKTFEKMAKEDAVFSRAFSIIDTGRCVKNILGENPKFCMWSWKEQSDDKLFPLQRSVPWHEGIVEEKGGEIKSSPEIHEEEDANLLSGIDNLKHSDIRVYSVINVPLWQRAGWKGMIYLTSPETDPLFVLGFENPEAGKAIFKGWQNRFGKVDENDYIRISIVRGVDKKKPHSYNVAITVNHELASSTSQKTHSFTQVKIIRMDPITGENLERFIENYERTKSYVMLPAFYNEPPEPPEIYHELGIKKQEISIREAWQIDEHDLDICALTPDVNPIIPSDIEDPPIHRAIECMRKQMRE